MVQETIFHGTMFILADKPSFMSKTALTNHTLVNFVNRLLKFRFFYRRMETTKAKDPTEPICYGVPLTLA